MIFESSRNSAGRFLKICKIQNGFLSQLFVPEEANGQGWRNFSSCINSLFNNKNEQKEARKGVPERKQSQAYSKADEKKIKNGVWRNYRKLEAPITNTQGWTRKDYQNKEWKNALVVYRNSIFISWGEIRKRVEDRLRRVVDLASLAADRAIIWCQNKEEINLLSNFSHFSYGKNHVKIKRWNQFVHWDKLQIQVKESWIGIEGLPINM